MTTGTAPLFLLLPQFVRAFVKPRTGLPGLLLLLIMALHPFLPVAAQALQAEAPQQPALNAQQADGCLKQHVPGRSERHDHAELSFCETDTEAESLLAALPANALNQVSGRRVPAPDYQAPGPAATPPFTARHHAPVFIFLQVFRL
ncbi:MAG: hypothetical protein IGS03_15815 [Candidatus Sericytochromatia bacterium]|nr:hypothetical protein [Candidatus Sericytochromatia bacterium]